MTKRTGISHVPILFLLLGSLSISAGLWRWDVRRDRVIRNRNYSQVDAGLYIGGAVSVPPPGTRAVINLCEKEDGYRTPAYLWEPIPDVPEDAPSLAWLDRMVHFIDSNRRDGSVVFVHCSSGVSRSALVVTAYQMYKNRWTREQAMAHVRAARPQIDPNEEFLEQLKDWEYAVVHDHDHNHELASADREPPTDPSP